jgi:hypothetical protein
MALKVRKEAKTSDLILIGYSRFNYEAALAGLLGRLWLRRLQRLQISIDVGSGQLSMDNCTKTIRNAMAVLEHCSMREPIVGINMRNVEQLQEMLDRM